MKITLTEFFENKEHFAIHCDTEEKANTLLKAFDKLGKWWWDGDSYLFHNYYFEHKNQTCYTNNGGYVDCDWCERHGYTIFEFNEVDLGN